MSDGDRDAGDDIDDDAGDHIDDDAGDHIDDDAGDDMDDDAGDDIDGWVGGALDGGADGAVDRGADGPVDRGAGGAVDADGGSADVVVTLPEALRAELKDPLGPIYTDVGKLVADAGEPLIAVGDIVTYHLLEAGFQPAVALVDGRTKRARVDGEVADAIEGFGDVIEVQNPAATLTAGLLDVLGTALARPGPTVITVDGEEDLAALPAVLVAPEGAAVVYGQPGEGMVLATVDEALKGEVRTLLSRMDGDHDRLWATLDVEDAA